MLSNSTGPAARSNTLRRLGALALLSAASLATPPVFAEPMTIAARETPSSDENRPTRSSFAEPRRTDEQMTPQACAADLHARFGAIADTELAALKAAKPVVGTVDPTLPGRLLFVAAVSRPALHDRPIKIAANLADLRGRVMVPASANSRWIADRIEMDLTDYLTQGPSPFLCRGLANYLETLRRYAEQVGTSSTSRTADIALQKSAATASIHAARLALRSPKRPPLAPDDRPTGLLSSRGLLIEAEMTLRTDGAGPVRLAGRTADAGTLADVPSGLLQDLGRPLPLASPADLLRAIDGLLDDSRRAGLLPADQVSDNLAAREAEEQAATTGRPTLLRLARVRQMLDRRAAAVGSTPAIVALETAFADLEALDYLLADADGRSDPIGTALARTMDAIEAAHAQACGCEA